MWQVLIIFWSELLEDWSLNLWITSVRFLFKKFWKAIVRFFKVINDWILIYLPAFTYSAYAKTSPGPSFIFFNFSPGWDAILFFAPPGPSEINLDLDSEILDLDSEIILERDFVGEDSEISLERATWGVWFLDWNRDFLGDPLLALLLIETFVVRWLLLLSTLDFHFSMALKNWKKF